MEVRDLAVGMAPSADGQSVAQRNKPGALGIRELFDFTSGETGHSKPDAHAFELVI